ncbi:MAG: hypothetical protein H6534_07875 [Chthonomonadaceae bacterium]|nr:hypothetical protein [Chthonomonadaceae bacterium]
MRTRVHEWTVRYGEELPAEAVSVPHAWRQDVPVSWEGPAIYETTLAVPQRGGWLVFEGVSYAAEVWIEGALAVRHTGIWDAFSVSLAAHPGKLVHVEVRVWKNGGPTYPVRDVASGFLPFVFHTFGGIYRDVWLFETRDDPLADLPNARPPRIQVDGTRLLLDGKPFLMRGVLHWGWYPETGHPNPLEETVRREFEQMGALGFNTVKCCLWVPSHRWLELAAEAGLAVWLELPLWDPAAEHLDAMGRELERIVLEFRRHDAIVCWTVGCELSESTPPGFRQTLVERVRELTGCPLVKDNSGGAEMYGGDPREFGDFYDFHPYCDTPFYPVVLDSLLPGSRTPLPTLLGEFNDIDVHRDLPRMRSERPYWAQSSDELNAIGVRWQHDLPGVLETCRFAVDPEAARHEALHRSSLEKAAFVRRSVQAAVRSRPSIGGYVVTGWRDTPVSSSGMIDDWGELKPQLGAAEWNSPTLMFLIPRRRPPWIAGGNRPGWVDASSHFAGGVHVRLGAHSEAGHSGEVEWSAVDFAWRGERRPGGRIAQGRLPAASGEPLSAGELGEIWFEAAEPGGVLLRVRWGGAAQHWPLWIVEPWSKDAAAQWCRYDPPGRLDDIAFGEAGPLVATRVPPDLEDRVRAGARVLLLLEEGPVVRAPFWRESAYEFLDDAFWARVGFADHWERFLPVSGDCVLDLAALLPQASWQTWMNRVDTRTYAEAPVLAHATLGSGRIIATTLRPDGGLGAQPVGVTRNPSGAALLRALLRELE